MTLTEYRLTIATIIGALCALGIAAYAWWRTVRPLAEPAPLPAPSCECRCECDVAPCPACPGGEECGL